MRVAGQTTKTPSTASASGPLVETKPSSAMKKRIGTSKSPIKEQAKHVVVIVISTRAKSMQKELVNAITQR